MDATDVVETEMTGFFSADESRMDAQLWFPSHASSAQKRRRRSKRGLHSDRLQSALSALQLVLDELAQCSDEEPRSETDACDDGSPCPTTGIITKASCAVDEEPTVSNAVLLSGDAGQECTEDAAASPKDPSSKTSVESDSKVDASQGEGKSASDAEELSSCVEMPMLGPVLEYQHKVLEEHDGVYPPLSSLKQTITASRLAKEAALTSQKKPLHLLEGILLSPADTMKLDVLRKRLWLEIPDDAHHVHCLETGLNPNDLSSRKLKKRWYEGLPLYSAAVMMLAQVSQQEMQAVKKKHKKSLGKGSKDDADGGNDGSLKNSTSLDPPLLLTYHPMPRLAATGYFDNTFFPLSYCDLLTPHQLVELLQAGEQHTKGLWGKLASSVSFRVQKDAVLDLDGGDAFGIDTIGASNEAVNNLLAVSRGCSVVSKIDASLCFSVYPSAPALQVIKVRKNPPPADHNASPFSRSRQVMPKYAFSWVDHWQHFLSNEEKRYSNPRVLASMYQAFCILHANGTDCRLWVVKRILRWIVKAKKALLRYTLLRCRLVYSMRRPQRDGARLLVPVEALPTSRPATVDAPTTTGTSLDDKVDENAAGEASQDSPPPVVPPEDFVEDDLEIQIDPLPMQDSGGVILVRSSARKELLCGSVDPLPVAPPPDVLAASEEAKDALRKAMQERIAQEVELNVVVVPTFDPLSHVSEEAAGGAVSSASRSAAADSFIESLSSKLCEIVIELEHDMRQRKLAHADLAGEVYRTICEQRDKDGGVIHPRKRKVLAKSDGVQLGLIKSAAAVEAQERLNPLTCAVGLALKKLRDFVVREVIVSHQKVDGGEQSPTQTSQATRKDTAKESQVVCGIVSLRELLCSIFRDEYHTRPQWLQEQSSSKKGGNHHRSDMSAAATGPVEDSSHDEGLRAFLKPVVKLDPVASGNMKSATYPYRLFHPMHMNFLENVHTYDDCSLFNLRRRERCCTNADVIEEISELFQRLVEVIQSVDSFTNDGRWDDSTTAHFSRAVEARHKRRQQQKTMLQGAPEVHATGLGPSNEKMCVVPKKQFGTVLRVLIDRMVRRLLVNVTQLMRMQCSDGRELTTPILKTLGVASAADSPPPAANSVVSSHTLVREMSASTYSSEDTHRTSRRTSIASNSLNGTMSGGNANAGEPAFSLLAERAAASNGGTIDHQFCDFFHGWKWFAEQPHTVERIWGPGKDFETDRDHLYDQLVDEMRDTQRVPLTRYTAFQEGGGFSPGNGRDDPGSLSTLRLLSESLSANFSVSAPISVAECAPLEGEELNDICALFPTVDNSHMVNPITDSAVRRFSRRPTTHGANSAAAVSGSMEAVPSGSTPVSRSFGDYLSEQSSPLQRSGAIGVPGSTATAQISSHVGEQQFVFTILHILDICHLALEATPSFETDGAAHLRASSHRGGKHGPLRGGKRVPLVGRGRGAARGKHASVSSSPARVPALDVRDSMFFRWRFHLKLRPAAFSTDIRHTMMSLFEKQVARDLVVNALHALKSTTRRLYLNQFEVDTVKRLEAERELQLKLEDKTHGELLSPVFGTVSEENDDDAAGAALSALLKQQATERRLGLCDDVDRKMRITAALSRLRVATQRFTGEQLCLMTGVRALLESTPPTEKECYLLMQRLFTAEFTKWDAHKSLAVKTVVSAEQSPTNSTPQEHSPLGSLSAQGALRGSTVTPRMNSNFASGIEPNGTLLAKPTNATVMHALSPRNSVEPPGTRSGSTASSNASQVNKSNASSKTTTQAAAALPVEPEPERRYGIIRCESCHQVPRCQLYCHKNQPKKVVVHLTEAEIDDILLDQQGYSSPNMQGRARSLGSRTRHDSSTTSYEEATLQSPGSPIQLDASSKARKKEMMKKNLTKIVTQVSDVFVCDGCLPDYLALCMVKRLIDVMHATQAAAAAESAALAAAAAEKLRKKIQEEIFGTAFIGEELSAEVFEQVQDEMRKRDEEAKKRAAKRGGDDDEDSSDEDTEFDDEKQFGVRRKDKKKKKKKHDNDDDDDFLPIASSKSKKKRRNVLEEKLAAVMLNVHREQLFVQEDSERTAIIKDAVTAFNAFQVDVAKKLYLDRNGIEPTSLDDLMKDCSLVLESVDDIGRQDPVAAAALAQQQAAADKLLSMARQQSQSRLKKGVSAVKLVDGFRDRSPSPSSPAARASRRSSSVTLLGSESVTGELDEFGLPLLRTQSGLTIEQLRQHIEAEEKFLDANRLMILKSDLEQKQHALDLLKAELGILLVGYDDRKEKHLAELALKQEAEAAQAASEKKSKVAAVLRAAAERFRAVKRLKGAEGEHLSEDDIIRLAKEAKEQQAATVDRLLRGGSRRALQPEKTEVNLFDDAVFMGDLQCVGDPEGTLAGAPGTVPEPPQRSALLVTWQMFDSSAALEAFKALCNLAAANSGATSGRFHLLSSMAAQTTNDTGMIPIPTLSPRPQTAESVASSSATRLLSAAYVAFAKDVVDVSRLSGASAAGMPQDEVSGSSALFVDEWFTHGEGDEAVHTRDDSLMLLTYLSRLAPLQLCGANSGVHRDAFAASFSNLDPLHDVLLQCAFVEESVCTLLDIACGLFQRADTSETHMEGYLQGKGGAMLELLGLEHPLQQELYQAIGAPTNSAAIARSVTMLQDAARRNLDPSKPATTQILRSLKPFNPQQLFGDAQKNMAKFLRNFLSIIEEHLRRPPLWAMETVKQVPKSLGVAPPLGVPVGGASAEFSNEAEDSDCNMLPQSPATSTLFGVAEQQNLSFGSSDVMRSPQMRSANPSNREEFESNHNDASAVAPWEENPSPALDEQDARREERSDSSDSSSSSDAGELRAAAAMSVSGDGLADLAPMIATSTMPRRRRKKVKKSKKQKPATMESSKEKDGDAAEQQQNQHHSEPDQSRIIKRRRSFRDQLHRAADSDARRTDRDAYLGCLAQVTLPALAIVAPDLQNVHSSLTQAWWQSRLVVVAVFRFYQARSFLSYRSMWGYSRRHIIIGARSANCQTREATMEKILSWYAKRFVIESPDGTQQKAAVSAQPQAAVAAVASDSREMPDDTQCAQKSDVATPPATPATPLPAAPQVTEVSGASASTRKYLNTTQLSTAETELRDSVHHLYHSHLALTHMVLEERSFDIVRAFATVDGALLLNERDCLRLTDTDVQQRIQRCIVARAVEALDDIKDRVADLFDAVIKDTAATTSSTGDARASTPSHGNLAQKRKRLVEFVRDVGRFALALFVMGPLVEAKSCLCSVAGIVPVEMPRFTAGLKLSSAVNDAEGVLSFVERRLFRIDADGSALVEEERDEAPKTAQRSIDQQHRFSDERVETPLFDEAATVEGWTENDDASLRALSSAGSRSHPAPLAHAQPTGPTAPARAMKSRLPNIDGSTTKKKVFRELSKEHSRMLAIVEKILFGPSAASQTDDLRMIDDLASSAIHSFYYGGSPIDVTVYGVELLLDVLASECAAENKVVCGARVHVPLRSMLHGEALADASDSSAAIDDSDEVVLKSLTRAAVLLGNALRSQREREVLTTPVDAASAFDMFNATNGSVLSTQSAGQAHTLRPTRNLRSRSVQFAESQLGPAEPQMFPPATAGSAHGSDFPSSLSTPSTANSRGLKRNNAASATSIHLHSQLMFVAALSALDEALQTVQYEKTLSRSQPAAPLVHVLALPIGDPEGGSCLFLHRFATEPLPASQLRANEELRRRQRQYYSAFYATVAKFAHKEKTKLYRAVGAEAPEEVPTLQDLVKQSLGEDVEESASGAKNPLDFLRQQRLSQAKSINEMLRQFMPSAEACVLGGNAALDASSSMMSASVSRGDASIRDGSPHLHGNSALAGQPSSPFKSRAQRGSIMMADLLKKAADRAQELSNADADWMAFSCGTGVITTEKFHFNRTSSTGSLDMSRPGTQQAASVRKAVEQIRKVTVAINRTVGADLPGATGDSGWNHSISVNQAFEELQNVAAKRKWRRSDGVCVSPRTAKSNGEEEDGADHRSSVVHQRQISLFDNTSDNDESRMEVDEGEDRRHSSIKEMTVEEARRYQRKKQQKSQQLRPAIPGLLDATGLLKGKEFLPHEFFVPVMSVAFQMMGFSDQTRSSMHYGIPPQWIEDSNVLMVMSLERKHDFNVTIRAAFLHDINGALLHNVPESDYASLFMSYCEENVWVPPAPSKLSESLSSSNLDKVVQRPQLPWIECVITRKKGIVMLTSALGEYRMSEGVLKVLIAASGDPHIHVVRGGTSLTSFVPEDDEAPSRAEDGRMVEEAIRRMQNKTLATSELGGLVDDAALSSILQRRAMLRRFFMPSSTGVNARVSYSSRNPYDPDAEVQAYAGDHIDWLMRYPLQGYPSPQGVNVSQSLMTQSDFADPEAPVSTYTNIDIVAYEENSGTGARQHSRSSKSVTLPPLDPDDVTHHLAKLRHALTKDEASPSKLPTRGRGVPLAPVDNRSASPRSQSALVQSAVDAASPTNSSAPLRTCGTTKIVTKWSQLLPKFPVAAKK